MLSDIDSAVAAGITRGAASWRPEKGRPEPALADALIPSLERALSVPVQDKGRSERYCFPGWNPKPRGIDLVAGKDELQPVVVFELKVEKVGEVLYDLYKLAALLEFPYVKAGYSVVAATAGAWQVGGQCAEIFALEPGREQTFESRELFIRNEPAWLQLRGWKTLTTRNSRGCPIWVRERLSVKAIVRCATLDDHYEVRAVAVTAKGEALPFVGDWPAGVTPKIEIPAVSPGTPRQPPTARETVDISGYEVPRHFGPHADAWLAQHVPLMSEAQRGALLADLRRRGWTDLELAQRVEIHWHK